MNKDISRKSKLTTTKLLILKLIQCKKTKLGKTTSPPEICKQLICIFLSPSRITYCLLSINLSSMKRDYAIWVNKCDERKKVKTCAIAYWMRGKNYTITRLLRKKSTKLECSDTTHTIR